MKMLAVVKIEFVDGERKDSVVLRTNSYNEAWEYVHAHENERIKIYDFTLAPKYKEHK